MSTSLMVLASLLLLLVLATTAHGIRLDRHLHEALNNKQEQLAGHPPKPNGAAASTGSKHCTSDGNCSGKAKKTPSPPAHAEPGASEKHQIPAPGKNDDDGDAESRQGAEVTWSGRALPRRPQQETRTYPDLVDIAGMDYSPARKPPIHN